MRVVNLSRHRDKLTLISGLLIIVFSIGLQLWARGGAGGGDIEALLQQIVERTDGLVRIVGRVFPSATWGGAQAMAYAHRGGQGWLNLIFLALASLAGVGGSAFYRGGTGLSPQRAAGFEASKGGGRRKKAAEKKNSKPPGCGCPQHNGSAAVLA